MRAQSQTIDAVNRLNAIAFLDGRKIAADLAIGDNQLETKLGRKFEGYFILTQDGASQIYLNQGTADRVKYLVLNSSAAVTVDVWVF